MNKVFIVFFVIVCCLPYLINAQTVSGVVFDKKSKSIIPFATVKFGNTGSGLVADYNGKFDLMIDVLKNEGVNYLEVSCLGYESRKIPMPKNDTQIFLIPIGKTLTEVTIKPQYDKIRHILKKAIENKNNNNPDKYPWYQCHVYYKMVVDGKKGDSLAKTIDEKDKKLSEFLDNQHFMMSETYSIRSWRKPSLLQEDVLATKLSGFKKSMFTSLVTDVLPFHTYSDYITLNSKDYHNPVSKGFEQYYKFNLSDEFLQGKDTVWILSFSPNSNNANQLKGKVYINSNGYAISYFVASTHDTLLKFTARIEQQYQQVNAPNNEKKWFPSHLNYILNWEQSVNSKSLFVYMKGTSDIDSVNFNNNDTFKFDKAHTVRLADGADEMKDNGWQLFRTEQLNEKDVRSYKILDSFGETIHLDETMEVFSKLPDLKLPIGKFDLDLKQLVGYNNYENLRVGLGLQTNEQVYKKISFGGYLAYGFCDRGLKYGLFTELYLDRFKEFKIKIGYTDDIADPGRIILHSDLDKNYLSSYLLWMVDNIKDYKFTIMKKFGYLNLDLNADREIIIPKYKYLYQNNGIDYKSYNATEVTLNLRYAFAERYAPVFNAYYSLGSKYPVWYTKICIGNIDSGKLQLPYINAITAIAWNKHINRIGFERFIIEGGKIFSNTALPVTKLFAGNGYNYNSTNNNPTIYTLGGMMTMTPYQFYTDQFVNVIFRHDFDWKLFTAKLGETGYSSSPNICLQYNMLYGTLNQLEQQKLIAFSVPTIPYHETGLLLNNIIRLKYINILYLTLNAGYFYHPSTYFNRTKDTRFVIGVGTEF